MASNFPLSPVLPPALLYEELETAGPSGHSRPKASLRYYEEHIPMTDSFLRFFANTELPLKVRENHYNFTKSIREHDACLMRMENFTRRNSVRIYGFPELPEEDIEMVVDDVLRRYMGIIILFNEITSCDREGEGSDRAIVVTFSLDEIKRKVMQNRDKLQGTNIVIFDDMPEDKVQILEAAMGYFGNENVKLFKNKVKCKLPCNEIITFKSYTDFERYIQTNTNRLSQFRGVSLCGTYKHSKCIDYQSSLKLSFK